MVALPELLVMAAMVLMAIVRLPTVARVVLVAIPGWRGLAASVVRPALVALAEPPVRTALLVLT